MVCQIFEGDTVLRSQKKIAQSSPAEYFCMGLFFGYFNGYHKTTFIKKLFYINMLYLILCFTWRNKTAVRIIALPDADLSRAASA
jgi:hypothetical protein